MDYGKAIAKVEQSMLNGLLDLRCKQPTNGSMAARQDCLLYKTREESLRFDTPPDSTAMSSMKSVVGDTLLVSETL